MRIDRFGEKPLYKTWVYSIVQNKCRDEIDKRKVWRRTFQEWPEPQQGDPDAQWLRDPHAEQEFRQKEAEIDLERLARDLTPEEGILFDCVMDGLDQNAIARRLGITVAAAETRRRRLIEKLQKIVASN